MNTCEMCRKHDGQAVVVDDNMETTLCAPCISELREHADVELIEVDA